MAKDPVCGMDVVESSAAAKHVYKGQTYLFCSHYCLAKFKENPEKFLRAPTREHLAHTHAHAAPQTPKIDKAEDTTYVCPMDAEVCESKPGACPKCGMALEPAAPSFPALKTEYVCRQRVLAAALEAGSQAQYLFPIRAAIVAEAKKETVPLSPGEDFRSLTGRGVSGKVDGRSVALGNLTLLQELSIDPGPLLTRAEELRREGHTVMFVAVDGRAAGLLAVSDPIKESTYEAIKILHGEGIRIVMVTGDSRTTAEAVARRLGIDQVEAEVLPKQKVELIKRLQSDGRIVAMAGDGVNDAPALAQAHVGIAMGTGTDVAIESAHVTLVKGDLRGIAKARRLSRATMRNIRQNLFFAFIYNVLGVPIAAGVLYPFFGILLSPIIASAAMTFSSVSVIANALRLRRIEL